MRTPIAKQFKLDNNINKLRDRIAVASCFGENIG